MQQKRTLVIGDIHGALLALKQVLLRANFLPEQDQLIFLGDYTDGYSEGAEVIEFLIQLKKQCKTAPIFIRGNHDDFVEKWLIEAEEHFQWKHQGGISTIDSYQRTGYQEKTSHHLFFKNLINYYIDKDNKAFVHGGFESEKGLGYEEYTEDYYWDRSLFTNAMKQQKTSLEPEAPQNAHKEVFIGHTPTTHWRIDSQNKYQKTKKVGTTKPINMQNIWNLDTGAGWGHKLTIMDIDTKEYFQSEWVADLYPNEKGR